MKQLKHLSVKNFLGAAAVEMDLGQRVMVVGPNGSGKSSIQNAIRFALAGDSVRVTLKKDTKDLIADGKASADIDIDGSQTNILKSKVVYSGRVIDPVPAFLLDMHSFSSAKPSERSAMLNDIDNDSAMSGDAILEAAGKAGLNIAAVKDVLPLVAASLADAQAEAEKKAKGLRSEWKGITGEVYGSEKALFWKPQVNHDARTQLADVDADIDTVDARLNELLIAINTDEHSIAPLRAACASIETAENGYKVAQSVMESLNAAADKIEEKLRACNPFEELCASLADVSDAIDRGESTCPHCQTPVLVLNADSGPHAIVSLKLATEAVAAQKKLLDEYSAAKTAARNASIEVGKIYTGLAKMRDAKARLEEISKEVPEGFKRDEAKAEASELREKKNALYLRRQELTRDCALLEQADDLVSRAVAAHEKVCEWMAVAEFFSPSGDAAALLNGPITRLATLLEEYAKATGWKPVEIGSDFSVSYGGRDYRMLSESEQWRVDAMIAAALVAMYNHDVPVILDRFDVLDLEGRAQLLDWVEQSPGQWLLFGTLKACPTLEGFKSYWIENGVSGL